MRFLSLAFILIFLSGVYASGQCPSIAVLGPAGVTDPGDKMTFRVEVGVVGPKLAYHWTVSAGTIVEGQGTPAISVLTDKSMAGNNVTATVEIVGLSVDCIKAASETAPIAPGIGCGAPVDEWGTIKPNDQRGRLDNVFTELANNPTSIGFLILNITSKERLGSNNQRIQFVVKHAKFRKFDWSRIWFALEFADEPRTKFYRIPPGAELPCSECLIIKGGDLN